MDAIRIRLTEPRDHNLPYYSHSIVENVLMCPRWGIIRYVRRRYYSSGYRALALEAGGTMHRAFAAFRITQLALHQRQPALAKLTAKRLFGDEPEPVIRTWSGDFRDAALDNCINAINTAEYVDDPSDKVRTLSNMETSIIRYVDEQRKVMDKRPVYFNPKTKFVGIENTFDFVIDDEFRFIGTIDGHEQIGPKSIRVVENKTASRLDETFRKSFMVKHQPTGYIVGTKLLLPDMECSSCRILGLKLKQDRTYESYVDFTETRDEDFIREWYQSVRFCHEIVQRYVDDPVNAPQFTHSCNRYFRPCGLIDMCAASKSDQQYMYEGMEEASLSPSEQALIDRWQ